MGSILVWSMEPFVETKDHMKNELIVRLQEFVEQEARSGSILIWG